MTIIETPGVASKSVELEEIRLEAILEDTIEHCGTISPLSNYFLLFIAIFIISISLNTDCQMFRYTKTKQMVPGSTQNGIFQEKKIREVVVEVILDRLHKSTMLEVDHNHFFQTFRNAVNEYSLNAVLIKNPISVFRKHRLVVQNLTPIGFIFPASHPHMGLVPLLRPRARYFLETWLIFWYFCFQIDVFVHTKDHQSSLKVEIFRCEIRTEPGQQIMLWWRLLKGIFHQNHFILILNYLAPRVGPGDQE